MLKRVDGWVLLYLKRNQNHDSKSKEYKPLNLFIGIVNFEWVNFEFGAKRGDSSGCKLNTNLNSDQHLK